MKNIQIFISLIITSCWTSYMVYNHPDMKPSDGYFIWVLTVLTAMYSVYGTIIFIVYINHKNTN